MGPDRRRLLPPRTLVVSRPARHRIDQRQRPVGHPGSTLVQCRNSAAGMQSLDRAHPPRARQRARATPPRSIGPPRAGPASRTAPRRHYQGHCPSTAERDQHDHRCPEGLDRVVAEASPRLSPSRRISSQIRAMPPTIMPDAMVAQERKPMTVGDRDGWRVRAPTRPTTTNRGETGWTLSLRDACASPSRSAKTKHAVHRAGALPGPKPIQSPGRRRPFAMKPANHGSAAMPATGSKQLPRIGSYGQRAGSDQTAWSVDPKAPGCSPSGRSPIRQTPTKMFIRFPKARNVLNQAVWTKTSTGEYRSSHGRPLRSHQALSKGSGSRHDPKED